MNDERCGTYAGYQAHSRRREMHCEDCREAARVYANRRRHASAEVRRVEYEQARARDRALTRLAAMHPTHYAALYAEESQGIDVPPRRPLGTFV